MALHSYEAAYTNRYNAGYGGSYFGDTSLPSTAASASIYDSASYAGSMSTFNSTALDEQQIYERLCDTSYKSRSDTLEHLRSVLRRSPTALPYSNPQLVFDGLALALQDSTWDVRQQAIQVSNFDNFPAILKSAFRLSVMLCRNLVIV